MSDTIHLACVTCKRYLWIGQGGYAAPAKAYLYETDQSRKDFSAFYDNHMGHDIRLVGMDGLDRLEGPDEFEEEGGDATDPRPQR